MHVHHAFFVQFSAFVARRQRDFALFHVLARTVTKDNNQSELQCMYKDKERNKFIKGKSLKSKKIYKITKVKSEEGSNDQH